MPGGVYSSNMKTKLLHVLFALSLLSAPSTVRAHGSMADPVSRVYQVYLENPQSPRSAAAQAAVAVSGTQAFYDWHEVSRLAPDRNYRGLIPDGQLPGAGREKYAGLNLVRLDWPATRVEPGAYNCRFHAPTPHEPSYFEVYITKADYNPAQALKWDDLERLAYLEPPSLDGNTYRFVVDLPVRTGRHMLYAVWQRVDPVGEVFFSASDIDFGGYNYDPSLVSDTSLPPVVVPDGEAPVDHDPSDHESMGPEGVVPVSGEDLSVDVGGSVWWGGFTAELHLTNNTADDMPDWSFSFTTPHSISGDPWGAKITAAEDAGEGLTRYTLTGDAWGRSIASGQTLTVGFNGTQGMPLGNEGSLTSADLFAPAATPVPEAVVPPAPVPEPTPAAPSQNTGELSVDVAGSIWWGGLTAELKLTNNSGADMPSWTFAFTTPHTISGAPWGARVASAEHLGDGLTRYTLAGEGWGQSIGAGQTLAVGFSASQGLPLGTEGTLTAEQLFASYDAAVSAPTPLPELAPEPSPEPSPEPLPVTGEVVVPIVPVAAPEQGDLPASSDPPSLAGAKIVGYFVEWGIYERNYNVSDIPADKLNVINYAFADISESGEVVLYDSWAAVEKAFPGDTWDEPLRGNFKQLIKLKEKHPHLITMISVGGWTLSGRFSDAALTAQSRARFAQSAVDFIVRYGFDGVDIDWEYPCGGGLESNIARPEDKQNYTLLLEELRNQLDVRGAQDGRKYYLSIAAPGSDDKIRNLEPSGIAEVCDWINIMTYDFAGSWNSTTGHHAPMFSPEGRGSENPSTWHSVDGAVRQFLDAGAPAAKLVVGVPFYGRGWSGISSHAAGLGQPSTGIPQGTFEAGMFDYKDLVARMTAEPDVYGLFEDTLAEASFIHAPSRDGLWVSFDDPEIVKRKVAYIKELGLGGAMFWELSGDTTDSSTSLLEVLYQGFRAEQN